MELEALINGLNDIIDILYNNGYNEGIGKLNEYLPCLADIGSNITDSNKTLEYTQILQKILEAMQSDDPILLGDVIKYELVDVINKYI